MTWQDPIRRTCGDWVGCERSHVPADGGAVWSKRGQRCELVAAPCVIDGPMNSTSFRAYVEQFLVPTLSAGDVVIMDNLAAKGQSGSGAKPFFLPRYSPDLNPIEQVFANLKTLLRKTDPRTTVAIWRGIGTLLDRSKPEECANFLVNAGYASA
jgi:transposase